MSTRSFIAIQHENGSFDAIYCHSDGYLTNNGKLLFENYRTPEKVQKLIDLGGISFLGTTPDQDPIIKKYGFLSDSEEFRNLPMEEQDKAWKKIYGTMAYHRDRGERLDIVHADSLAELNAAFKDSWTEYLYLFKKSSKTGEWSWSVKTIHDNGQEFIPDCIDHKLEVNMTHGHWYSLTRIMKRYYQLKAEQEKEQAKQPA